MLKNFSRLWIALCILLVSCQTHERVPASTETITTTVAGATPSTSPPTLQLANAISPVFLFPNGNSIDQQIGNNAPEMLVNLPGAGQLRAADWIGDTVLLLTEQGVQRVSATTKQATMIVSFNSQVQSGQLVPAGDNASILYSAILDDPQAPSGTSTVIGVYKLNGIAQRTISFPQTMRILGLTPDRNGLYCLPIGQDPEFGNIVLVDLEKGVVSSEPSVYGFLFASLAPNSRLLATVIRQPDSSGQLNSMIGIYDLASPPSTPTSRTFPLPLPPSHVGGFLWSPDSRKLYFLDLPGYDFDNPTTSNGLWSLSMQSEKLEKIANVPDPNFTLEGISPNGEWILLLHYVPPHEAILVRLSDGTTQTFITDLHAVFAGWQ